MSEKVATLQRYLRSKGHDLGTSGPAHDGVDGVIGNPDTSKTLQAIIEELMKSANAPVVPPMAAPDKNPIALISLPVLKAAAPEQSDGALSALIEPIKTAAREFQINTVRRVAAFIAQMAHESGLKVPRNENLNYSAQALISGFGRHRISIEDANRYGRIDGKQAANQEMIANTLYGGEYGRKNLGNIQPGDGWTFRGGGPLQVTGRANWTAFAERMKMSLEDAMKWARETPEGGIMSAAWFWEENDINRLADTPGVSDETRAINGGQKGLDDRKTRFDRTVQALLRAGA